LESSGVNKLLSFAQEVGVRGMRSVERTKASQRDIRKPSVEPRPARIGPEVTDLRVSLSDFARHLAEGLPAEPTAQTSVSTQETPLPPPIETEPPRQPEVEPQGGLRRQAGFAAYKRNAQAIPGERIRVIA